MLQEILSSPVPGFSFACMNNLMKKKKTFYTSYGNESLMITQRKISLNLSTLFLVTNAIGNKISVHKRLE